MKKGFYLRLQLSLPNLEMLPFFRLKLERAQKKTYYKSFELGEKSIIETRKRTLKVVCFQRR